MIGSKFIKVGNATFNVDIMRGMTLTDAYKRYDYIRKDVVKKAHEMSNPKRKTKKRSKK